MATSAAALQKPGSPEFAAPTEGRQPKKEWVLRTSSRIWRGSMAGRDWKYLSQVRRLWTKSSVTSW